MAKANLTLPNGTLVNIEGTTEEVQRLLDLYSGVPLRSEVRRHEDGADRGRLPDADTGRPTASDSQVDLVELVNLIRTCDDSERIESAVLDSSSVLNRVLLPLFIVHEHKGNAFGLTSGEISKITVELGVPVTQPNVSTSLSGPAKSHVIGDKMRIKGQPVRYKLNRRGVQHFRQILTNSNK